VPRFGRADKKGRSSGVIDRRDRRLIGPPKGEPFSFLPLSLLESPAWRSAPLSCRRFIDALLADHCHHAGRENGNLQATYNQLVKGGMSRKSINSGISEAIERGLVRKTKQGGLFGIDQRRTTSRYRITWIGTLDPPEPPTNDWKRFKHKIKSSVPASGTAPHASLAE
jgi:hypothetical protein